MHRELPLVSGWIWPVRRSKAAPAPERPAPATESAGSKANCAATVETEHWPASRLKTSAKATCSKRASLHASASADRKRSPPELKRRKRGRWGPENSCSLPDFRFSELPQEELLQWRIRARHKIRDPAGLTELPQALTKVSHSFLIRLHPKSPERHFLNTAGLGIDEFQITVGSRIQFLR